MYLLWFWFYDSQVKTALTCFDIQLSSNQPEIQNRFVSPDAKYINISVVIIGKIKKFYAKQ